VVSTPWHADLNEITVFVQTLFRYAESRTWVSLRSFDQFNRAVPPSLLRGVQINGTLDGIIKEATIAAEETAQYDAPSVFCPPIATFTDPWKATTAHLANGLSLSVELDEADPNKAQTLLEGVLGPVTIVVRSGSDWIDPVTGEVHAKVHLHWRLTEPTTTTEDHERLRHTRAMATLLAGGDPTGKPVVHPLRWPGSWNLKTNPRMATIAVLHETAEINLDDAVEALELAVEAAGIAQQTPRGASSTPEAPLDLVRSAMAAIPNLGDAVSYPEWIRFGYAVWRATGGSDEGFEIWDNWSRLSDKYEAKESTANVWRAIGNSIRGSSVKVINTAGAGTIFFHAARAGWVRPFPLGADHRADDSYTDDDAGKGQERQRRQESEVEFRATSLDDLDLDNIPPRQWIYGRELVRGFVSVLASTGGTGKTAYTMAVGVSVALSRSLLHTGISDAPPHLRVHRQGAVWFYNLEDPQDELRRRIKATIQHHRTSPADLSGRIFLDSGRDRPLVIAVRVAGVGLVQAPVIEPLIVELKRRAIAVLVVDPFVQSHGAEENRNEEMNIVMAAWGRVANEANCAVWLVHHFRKGGVGGDADAIRGAGAIQGSARSMHTLSTMTVEEATSLTIPGNERWQYIRHDNVKQNMAPTAGKAVWFRLVSVTLGNGTADYPEGDFVQAVEAWNVPGPWEGVTWDKIEKILVKIDQGTSEGEFYAMNRQAKNRWAGNLIMEICRNSYAQAGTILAKWKETGLLEEGEYMSRKWGRTASCVRVNQMKFSEMRRVGAAQNTPDDY